MKIPFYIVPGNGVLLLGNEVCSKSNVLGPRNVIEAPPGVLSEVGVSLPIYSEPVGPAGTDGIRTYLAVVPSKLESFGTLLSHHSYSTNPRSLQERLSSESAAKKFAVKLHTYSHLRGEDMRKLCERAGVLSKTLDDALKLAVDNCKS